ncbi:uncharacterized protein RCC_00969 [Ramularia collo-cygni]|uniref:Extracellular membrane protein CFEM domain-containing protein n=1 Tax=Ramularia collo-cygni TaxID=112498 RepID=A0A2D3ULK5_9PEZI|nr:uncharacterized protein RCC_00969 [Ramularia collo-cygni]CZT15062.1 uncharacterized protein RCC_00969 [Ramularia collo-cygni]
MHGTTLLISSLALGFVHFTRANEGIEFDDVPNQCRDVCTPVVELSESCDNQSFSSNDREIQCICTGQNMATAIPDCEACIRPFWQGSDDDDYDETNNLLRRCGLTAASETSSGASSSTSMSTSTGSSASQTTSTSSSTSTDASGSPTVVAQTTTFDGGVGGAFATPAAGVGLAAVMAVVVAL